MQCGLILSTLLIIYALVSYRILAIISIYVLVSDLVKHILSWCLV
jgi:hypothetical protein